MWAGFATIVAGMLAIDLLVVSGGKQHRVSMREAATWSGIWVGVALAFAAALWWYFDASAGRAVANEITLEFVTDITDELHGERFFVMREAGGKLVRYATPLFLVLVLVELSLR